MVFDSFTVQPVCKLDSNYKKNDIVFKYLKERSESTRRDIYEEVLKSIAPTHCTQTLVGLPGCGVYRVSDVESRSANMTWSRLSSADDHIYRCLMKEVHVRRCFERIGIGETPTAIPHRTLLNLRKALAPYTSDASIQVKVKTSSVDSQTQVTAVRPTSIGIQATCLCHNHGTQTRTTSSDRSSQTAPSTRNACVGHVSFMDSIFDKKHLRTDIKHKPYLLHPLQPALSQVRVHVDKAGEDTGGNLSINVSFDKHQAWLLGAYRESRDQEFFLGEEESRIFVSVLKRSIKCAHRKAHQKQTTVQVNACGDIPCQNASQLSPKHAHFYNKTVNILNGMPVSNFFKKTPSVHDTTNSEWKVTVNLASQKYNRSKNNDFIKDKETHLSEQQTDDIYFTAREHQGGGGGTHSKQTLPLGKTKKRLERPTSPFTLYGYTNLEHLPDSLDNIKIPKVEDRDVVINKVDGSFKTLGQGSFGSVYLAEHKYFPGMVCVKEFDTDNVSKIDIYKEAQLLVYLKSTQFVPECLGLMKSQIIPTDLSLVQECFANGHTLKQMVNDDCHRHSERMWLGVCYQLYWGLHAIHDKHVLLNDVKADNVLVDCTTVNCSNNVRYIDLGLATYRQGYIYNNGLIYLERFNHLAPEVQRGNHTTPASDLYGVGYMVKQIGTSMKIPLLCSIATMCMAEDPSTRPLTVSILGMVEDVLDTLDLGC